MCYAIVNFAFLTGSRVYKYVVYFLPTSDRVERRDPPKLCVLIKRHALTKWLFLSQLSYPTEGDTLKNHFQWKVSGVDSAICYTIDVWSMCSVMHETTKRHKSKIIFFAFDVYKNYSYRVLFIEEKHKIVDKNIK